MFHFFRQATKGLPHKLMRHADEVRTHGIDQCIFARAWAILLGCLLCFCGCVSRQRSAAMCKPPSGSASSPFQLDQHDWTSALLINFQ